MSVHNVVRLSGNKMQELNTNEINQVDGAAKTAISIFGFTASYELSQESLIVSTDILGFKLFGLELPI